jgi:phenylalanyl-tRNA synthetase beta chain
MKISWKWLNELVDLNAAGHSPEQLAETLTRRGLEVEEVSRQDAGLEKVVTARILERKPHPQADRLSLCKVSTGTGEPLDIVCGAQNMKAGDIVALAQVGALLPNGLKIEKSKIRGEVSNGMLCSEQELKLADTSEGILILPPDTKLGQPLAAILGRDDVILSFKLTANRGDCLSHFGMAREVSAALNVKPKPRHSQLLAFGETRLPIAIELEAGEAAPQFYGCSIRGVKIGPSPAWLVRRLEALGSRSINNVVDATNLVMLELGHPMHAYDATLLKGGRIAVRTAREGEDLPLLDGATIRLQGWELVIADAERAVGLAGVMGGGNSEVRDSTTELFLECAEFEPTLVRRASSAHQRKTDAAHRFERGIDPTGLGAAISRLAHLIIELAGGAIAGADARQLPSRRAGGLKGREIPVDPAYFESFLGMNVPLDEAERVLRALHCDVRHDRDGWVVVPPPFRHDLKLPEDLAEELARSLGYDLISETIPPLSSAPQSVHASATAQRSALIEQAKDALVRLGFHESVNLSFTSRAKLEPFGLTPTVRVLNPMSEDHEALVPSLIPGLVHNALTNWNHHFGSETLGIRLFELRPTFHAPVGEIRAASETQTPVEERWRLTFVLAGPRLAGGMKKDLDETIELSDVRGILESLFDTLGARGIRMQPLTASRTGGNPLFHPGQSVEILAGNSVAGWFGPLHPGKARELKCRGTLWIADLDWEALAKLSRGAFVSRTYKPVPEFPAIERDFAIVLKGETPAEKIVQLALKAGKPLAKVARVFDVYRGSSIGEGMTSVAVRVIFYEESRVLQESEAEAASAQILEAWKKELGAELRS